MIHFKEARSKGSQQLIVMVMTMTMRADTQSLYCRSDTARIL